MIVYADTSALLKRLVAEEGSELAGQVWSSAERVVSSELIYPEARAALGAMRRAGRLDEARVRKAICRLERMHDGIELVRFDRAAADLAGGLAQRHRLRGSDAVHLATAIAYEAPRVVVATWDRRLATASAEEGMAVVPALPVPVAV